jgi:hypothetical protein
MYRRKNTHQIGSGQNHCPTIPRSSKYTWNTFCTFCVVLDWYDHILRNYINLAKPARSLCVNRQVLFVYLYWFPIRWTCMFANVLCVTKRKAVKNSFHIFVVKVWKSNTIPRNSIQPAGIFLESSGKMCKNSENFQANYWPSCRGERRH